MFARPGGSGECGKRSGARERVDERVAPGPARVDAQDRCAGVEDEASGDVKQPVVMPTSASHVQHDTRERIRQIENESLRMLKDLPSAQQLRGAI